MFDARHLSLHPLLTHSSLAKPSSTSRELEPPSKRLLERVLFRSPAAWGHWPPRHEALPLAAAALRRATMPRQERIHMNTQNISPAPEPSTDASPPMGPSGAPPVTAALRTASVDDSAVALAGTGIT